MIEIALKPSGIALIDASDLELIASLKWTLDPSGRYATTRIGPRSSRRHVRMHRFLLNPPTHLEVDHINGNGLDNRRANLRIATKSQNGMNRCSLQTNNRSGVNGVHFYVPYGKWRVRVTVNKKQIHIGYFDTIEEAAEARRKAELRHYGVFAPNATRADLSCSKEDR